MSGRLSWLLAFVVIARLRRIDGLVGGDDSSRAVTGGGAGQRGVRARRRASHPVPRRRPLPAIIVVTRRDGGPLTPADVSAIEQQRPGAGVRRRSRRGCPRCRWTPRLSGFALNDAVKALRHEAAEGLPSDLRAEVTGGPAFGADIANSFAGANITLLAVTAAVVALLLIVTYRSPVLWLVPLAVIGFADRVAAVVGTAVADADRHEPGRVDVGHHQRAGVRRGHQLCLAAHLALSRGAGPQRRSPRRPCAWRSARPGQRSWPATPPSCWRC